MRMAITTREARQEILDELGRAIEQLELAGAALGEAYELLSVGAADRLEAELFRPVQRANGRAKRTQAGFAERIGMAGPVLAPPSPGPPSQGAKSFVERALAAAGEANRTIAELQDSMLPIESVDAELRAGLTEVRELMDGLPNATREFLRTLGR
jgi:hypothetical protein